MGLILLTIGTLFAAAGIWLVVRYFNHRERWVKRLLIVAVLLILAYPLSTGPMAWLRVHVLPPWTRKPLDLAYLPLAEINRHIPGANEMAIRYLLLWVDLDEFLKTAAVDTE